MSDQHEHDWKVGTHAGSDVRERLVAPHFQDPVSCLCGATAWRHMEDGEAQISDLQEHQSADEPIRHEAQSQAESAVDVLVREGEREFLNHLAQHAHPEQGATLWDEAGIIILEDGSAVVREKGRYILRQPAGDDEWRYRQVPSKLPEQERTITIIPQGPIYRWPDLDALWDEIDQDLGAAAAGLADEILEEGGNQGMTTDPDMGTGLTLQEAVVACPALADAVRATLDENRQPPESIAERIQCDVGDMARSVMDKLEGEPMQRLEQCAAEKMAAHELAERQGG